MRTEHEKQQPTAVRIYAAAARQAVAKAIGCRTRVVDWLDSTRPVHLCEVQVGEGAYGATWNRSTGEVHYMV